MRFGIVIRNFKSWYAFAAFVAFAWTSMQCNAATNVFKVEAFDLRDVTLLDGPFKAAMDRNAVYLLNLEPDRFLHYFRKEVGLEPKAEPYAGWESPTTGAGRCLGHYLSALSLQFRATNDERFKQRVAYIVNELAACQNANGNGYLSAQANLKEAFTELSQGKLDLFMRSRVPWYIQHKMFAGLRDACLLAGNDEARRVLLRLTDWAIDVTKDLTDEQFQAMLNKEFGGLQEALADVYAISGDHRHLDFAKKFYHRKVQDPWKLHQDNLRGLHANTQIPKATGLARIYELTGDAKMRDAAEFLWDTVVHHHSYVIGGNSEHEVFSEPDHLANHLGPTSAETCNTYNLLKLTRHLFQSEPKVEYIDYYERALYNHILASQDPERGMFAYYVSLKPGHFKTFSTPFESFWCCVGTGMENHTKYAGDIYFHDLNTLYVNLFIPSELNWRDRKLKLMQRTSYPETNVTILKVSCDQPQKLSMKIRTPAWVTNGLRFRLNKQPVAIESRPGAYANIEREWKDGDELEVTIPLELRTESMPDDSKKIAVLYGPLVLGGRLGTNGMASPVPYARDQGQFFRVTDPEVPRLQTRGESVSKWLLPIDGPLTFRTKGVGRPEEVTLVPFHRLNHERYTVYWDTVAE